MSCRHSFRSKPMEALISCIITDGPRGEAAAPLRLAAALRLVGRLAQDWSSVMLLIRRRRILRGGRDPSGRL